ncbi:MAG: MASE1 domain-containing protein, partial [Acidobacteria bacterium]|nr:MASE1 domain-containing protein [Acidobacteriota bacterium]
MSNPTREARLEAGASPQVEDRVSPEPLRLLRFSYLARVVVLLVVYYATAKLGLLMDPVGGFATTVWPPTGISLVTLSLFGYRLWPGIALGAFLVNASAGAPLLAACGMAAGNTLEALLGTYLLRRYAGFQGSLERIQQVFVFVVLAAGLSTMLSATIGVTSGYLGGVIPYAETGKAWMTWWLGDAMGALLLAPLLFAWRRRPRIHFSILRLVEGGILILSLGAVTLAAFGTWPTPQEGLQLQAYAVFPFLIWAALRFGQHGTVTTTFLVACIAIVRTSQGAGPFARESVNESLLLLQAFMGIVAVTMLVLSADVTQRRTAEEELLKAQEDLERRVARRTAQLSEVNRSLQEEIGERMQVAKSLEELSTRLLNIQDEERHRLARELHDSTAQSLAALSMNLAVAGRSRDALDVRARTALDESVSLAERCSREIRSLSYLLHPPLLEEVGLPAALRWLVEGFSRRSGIAVGLDVPGEFGRLPMEVENALFRIVQECLTNVQRHSESGNAWIKLARGQSDVRLEVRDDGRGLPAEVLSRRGGVELLGVGILGMRERVRQLGGHLGIDS